MYSSTGKFSKYANLPITNTIRDKNTFWGAAIIPAGSVTECNRDPMVLVTFQHMNAFLGGLHRRKKILRKSIGMLHTHTHTHEVDIYTAPQH